MLEAKGRIQFSQTCLDWVRQALAAPRLRLLQLTQEIAIESSCLPGDIHGDRAYRYLHMDAGHLGQRLNLAAIYLDLGVSGIGGFFDNQVNEVLGIPADEAVIYITTLGRPRRA